MDIMFYTFIDDEPVHLATYCDCVIRPYKGDELIIDNGIYNIVTIGVQYDMNTMHVVVRQTGEVDGMYSMIDDILQ